MNNEKKTTLSVVPTQQGGIIPVRAESYKVIPRPENYTAFRDAVKAYAIAGMPMNHIANAGEHLNEAVYADTSDAFLQEGFQGKIGEVVENEGSIIAWQSRGEKITIVRELPSANESGSNVIPISDTVTQTNQPQAVDVIEGIAVVKEEPTRITGGSTDYSELTNSPFLKANADFKKAA